MNKIKIIIKGLWLIFKHRETIKGLINKIFDSEPAQGKYDHSFNEPDGGIENQIGERLDFKNAYIEDDYINFTEKKDDQEKRVE